MAATKQAPTTGAETAKETEKGGRIKIDRRGHKAKVKQMPRVAKRACKRDVRTVCYTLRSEYLTLQ